MEGIETSLHGSGQLDYEVAQYKDINPTPSNQITPTKETMQADDTVNSPQIEPTREVSHDVGVVSRLSEVEELKNDMVSVWGMSRERSYDNHHQAHITTGTPSQPAAAVSHSRTTVEWESHTPQVTQNSTTHTITSSHHHSAHSSQTMTTSDDDLVTIATTNPVSMETETTVSPKFDQSKTASATITMTTKESPWFSLTPRSPCETRPAAVPMATVAGAQTAEGQYQLVSTAGGLQQQILQPSAGMMQYYITPSGTVATQQVQVGYALVGNTLVPQQYVTTAPQQQFIISQGGIQYLVGGTGGLMGLGGLAVVPQGGLAIGEGVVQAIAGGSTVVMGDAATTTIAASNTVETVAVDNSNRSTAVIAAEEPLTNHMTESSAADDTHVSMDTTTSSAATMETRAADPKPISPPNKGGCHDNPTTAVDDMSAADVKTEDKKPEYITAVLPGQGMSHSRVLFPVPHTRVFPDGQSQYVSLPADPRVLSGEYSYAVLQQSDGSSHIVLMENS